MTKTGKYQYMSK